MQASGSGYEQDYNGQAVVGNENSLIVGNHVSQISNNRHELAPPWKGLQGSPKNWVNPRSSSPMQATSAKETWNRALRR